MKYIFLKLSLIFISYTVLEGMEGSKYGLFSMEPDTDNVEQPKEIGYSNELSYEVFQNLKDLNKTLKASWTVLAITNDNKEIRLSSDFVYASSVIKHLLTYDTLHNNASKITELNYNSPDFRKDPGFYNAFSANTLITLNDFFCRYNSPYQNKNIESELDLAAKETVYDAARASDFFMMQPELAIF